MLRQIHDGKQTSQTRIFWLFSLNTNFIGDEKRADIFVAEIAPDGFYGVFLSVNYAWHFGRCFAQDES